MALDEAIGTISSKRPSALVASGGRRRVVDADSHLDPPYEMWAEYLPAHLRELAPRIEEGDDCDFVVFEGRRRPIVMNRNQAGRASKDYKMFGKLSDMRAAWLPNQRLADMDQDGLDAAVLFGGGPLGTANSELYIASFETYNRWVWDFCAADRRRLVPVAYLPMRNIDETLRLLNDAAKLGFRSVNIPAFPQAEDGITTSARVAAIQTGQGAALAGNPSGELQYSHPDFDRLWAAFSEFDMTVTIHLGARIPRFGEKQHFLPDMVMSKLAMAEPIAIAIFSGIFERFPKLRFVTVESAVGWFAWVAEHMDRTWERQRHLVDNKLAEKPSFYMDRNVYGSFITDRTGILNRNAPGGGNIMWSSDYPHSETTFPRSHEVIARDFEGVPEEDIREIICERARRVYAVD
ncbi:MAG: amidohydrolase [Rhodospirillaceae bacterium]|nr:MAG: amidohydrolase [Rhodospirillaceae bacterium]